MKISDKLFTHKGYELCEQCSKRDKFITQNIHKINFDDNSSIDIKYGHKHYSIIKKAIYNVEEHNIGYIVLFQDITVFKNQLESLIFKSIILFLLGILITFIVFSTYMNTVFKKLTKARFLLDNTNDAVYVVCLKDGRISDVNNRSSEMLGFTKDELLTKKLQTLEVPLILKQQLIGNII